MMGQKYCVASMFAGALGKKFVPATPCRDFHRDLVFLRAALDVRTGDFKGQVAGFCLVPDEGCIVRRKQSTQLVIQVAKDNFVASSFDQGMEQSDRVPSTGYAQKVAPTWRKAGIEN